MRKEDSIMTENRKEMESITCILSKFPLENQNTFDLSAPL